jgi:hypothetical protein
MQCDTCGLFGFATVGFYPQQMDIKTKEVCKIAKNTPEKCVYSIGVLPRLTHFHNQVIDAQIDQCDPGGGR